MPEPRPVTDPERMIAEFDVYRLADGRWLAVLKARREVRTECDDWERLFAACIGLRSREAQFQGFGGVTSWSEAEALEDER